MNWIKKIGTVVVACAMGVALAAPAYADPTYDFSVNGSAVANSTTLPSVITWTIDVASVGDDMGNGAAQEGTVTFTTPNTISLTLSSDCTVSGHAVTCTWLVQDGVPQSFQVVGLVSLLALGAINVTPTIVTSSPRTDSNGANDSATISCTAVTSLLVTC